MQIALFLNGLPNGSAGFVAQVRTFKGRGNRNTVNTLDARRITKLLYILLDTRILLQRRYRMKTLANWKSS